MRDAVLLGVQHLRSRAKRDKRVLVVITDGEDNASVASQQRLIEAAHQNNAIIYGDRTSGRRTAGVGGAGAEGLEELTNATGGRSWFPTDVNDDCGDYPRDCRTRFGTNMWSGTRRPTRPKMVNFARSQWKSNVPGAIVRTRSGITRARDLNHVGGLENESTHSASLRRSR